MHEDSTVQSMRAKERARATGKATPAAIYSYIRNALPVLVGTVLASWNSRRGEFQRRVEMIFLDTQMKVNKQA